jgi:hypothetical protein
VSLETEAAPAVPRSANPAPPRWIELIPLIVLGGSFGVMAAFRPNAVRDLFSGTQAVLVTLGIVAGWLLLSRVILPRLVRNGWMRVGVLSVLAVGLVLVLILPTVVDKKVVEALPDTRSNAQPERESSITPDPAPAPSEPVALGTDSLRGIDHDASGTAVLYGRPDGSFFVGLEGIDIEPGPDYKVYVVPGANRESPGDDGVFLDDLRGNQGTQFYDVPGGTDAGTGEWTVLVWCRSFAVPIANATL